MVEFWWGTSPDQARGLYEKAQRKQPSHLPPFPPAEDPDDAYAILAKEMNSMSIEERDSVLWDIHGVPKNIEESSSFIDDSLRKLFVEIEAIRTKAAYLMAVSQSKANEDDKTMADLGLRFLRAHRYNLKDAAAAMVAFFEVKMELFGENSLGRDVTLSQDFDEKELEFVKRGFYQVFPGSDNSGRTVVGHFPGIVEKNDIDIRTKMKNLFYFLMVLSENEHTQKVGVVGIAYRVGSSLSPDRAVMWRTAQLQKVCPLRFNCFHYCYDNEFVRPIINFGLNIVGEDIRHRARVHFGSAIECIYILSTFGITNTPITTAVNNEIDLRNHLQWVSTRLVIEKTRLSSPARVAKADCAGENPSSKVIPGDQDVLFGRGKGFQYHKGNVWCRDLVENRLDEYNLASKRKKTEIADEIVNAVFDRSGRFLRREKDRWVQVDETEARYKISHMFRGRRQRVVMEDENVSDTVQKKQRSELTTQDRKWLAM